MLLALRVPPHIVQEIVGHRPPRRDHDHLAHASLDEKRAALRKLDGRLR
jgi:hypothetical protein